MEIAIEIEGADPSLIEELQRATPPAGVEFRYGGRLLEESVEGLLDVAVLSLTVAKEVAIGLVSSWLWSRLRGRRAKRLRMERYDEQQRRVRVTMRLDVDSDEHTITRAITKLYKDEH